MPTRPFSGTRVAWLECKEAPFGSHAATAAASQSHGVSRPSQVMDGGTKLGTAPARQAKRQLAMPAAAQPPASLRERGPRKAATPRRPPIAWCYFSSKSLQLVSLFFITYRCKASTLQRFRTGCRWLLRIHLCAFPSLRCFCHPAPPESGLARGKSWRRWVSRSDAVQRTSVR